MFGIFPLCMLASKILKSVNPNFLGEPIVKVELVPFDFDDSEKKCFQLHFTRQGDSHARYVLAMYFCKDALYETRWYREGDERIMGFQKAFFDKEKSEWFIREVL